jgi:hypothetical protein
MEMATGWTGKTACALRTVASWHEKPALRPRPEIQRALDTVLEQAPPAVKERFALLTGGPAHTGSDPSRADAGTGEDSAAADAEHRLIADENISLALSRLDQLASWEPGTARRKVAALLSGLDRRHVLDRAGRRARIGRRRIARALDEYYHGQADGHGRYGARCGEYSEIVTSVLTHPDWLDLDCPLTRAGDRLTLAGATTEGGTLLDQQAAEAATWRLAETLSADTRLVDMPLYRPPASTWARAGSAGRWPSRSSPRTRWRWISSKVEASWESSALRQYSSLDGDSLANLPFDDAWSNEGLFAFLQGLRRLRELGGDRVDIPAIEWGVRP